MKDKKKKKKKVRPMNKKGQMIIIQLLFLFMTIVVLVALIPALRDIIDIAQQSDGLNCAGYYYNGNAGHVLSYNSSLSTNTTACLAIKLYLPYIVLVVLIAGVTRLFYGQAQSAFGQPSPGGY